MSFYKDACLVDQMYVHQSDRAVFQIVEQIGKDAGSPVRIVGFHRFALGEGVEKDDGDFAGEVNALLKG
jgi:elongation factor Ts